MKQQVNALFTVVASDNGGGDNNNGSGTTGGGTLPVTGNVKLYVLGISLLTLGSFLILRKN